MIATTAAPLPVTAPPGDFRDINAFCQKCGNCIRKCPAGAIRETPLASDTYGMASCVDAAKGETRFYNHSSCGICIQSCPFHRVGYDRLMGRKAAAPAAAVIGHR